jgi:tetratricopeptide (TPR) repeat protein
MDCSICLQLAVVSFIRLDCKHIFHTTCLSKWAQLSNSCPMCRSVIVCQSSLQSYLFKAKVLSKSRCFASALVKLKKAELKTSEIISVALHQTRSWTQEEQKKFITIFTHNVEMEIKNAKYEIIYDLLKNIHHFEAKYAIYILGLFIKSNGFIRKSRLYRAILLQRLGKFDDCIKDLNIILRMEPRNKVLLKMKQNAKMHKNYRVHK